MAAGRPANRYRREGKKARRARTERIIGELKVAFPDAHCELEHRSPFELLVATILSAQCTDKRVNIVTPALFERFPDPVSLGAGPRQDIETLIHSTGFYRNKAKNLQIMAQTVVSEHDSEIPLELSALVKLPGVGRKTANVILGEFATPEGVVVDTHVQRISQRLSLTRHPDPIRIERDLMDIVPRMDWALIAHLLIWHGRRTCSARKPKCDSCPLVPECPSAMLG